MIIRTLIIHVMTTVAVRTSTINDKRPFSELKVEHVTVSVRTSTINDKRPFSELKVEHVTVNVRTSTINDHIKLP